MNDNSSQGSVRVHAYHLQELQSWTDNLVRVAFRMARHGQKDEARDILRSVENGCFLELIKAGGFDVIALKEALHTLRDECHPLTQPKRDDDIKDLLARVKDLEKFKRDAQQERMKCEQTTQA